MIIIKDKTTNSQLFIPRVNDLTTADYVTKEEMTTYVNTLLGDINKILEDIIG